MLNHFKGLLKKLAADQGGNVLVLGAVSLLALLGMLGGAFDMTRTYLVRSRLQQACDAAVLAGRSAMGNQA